MLKKKIIIIASIALLLLLGIGIICYYNIPRLSFDYSNDYGGYIVDKAYGNNEKYTIPKTYKGKNVVGIGSRAFMGKDNLEEIIFEEPANIYIIERLAFSECSSLKIINLEHVQIIERNSFSYCVKLNNIIIGAKHIGASAFYKCNSLESLELKEGLISIGSLAFGYTSIEEIKLPRSTKDVYIDCFLYMDELKSIIVYGDNLVENNYLKTLNNVNYVR